jgi:hypothetical protein
MIGSVFKNNTSENLVFGPMIDSVGHITGVTGATLTVTISKNGGAFAAPQGAVTEIGAGLYQIAANALDANTVGVLAIHATGAGCDPYDDKYDVVDNATLSPVSPAPASTLTTVNVTAQDLVNGALKLLGVQAAGETLAPQDAVDGFARLNELIDSWGTQRQTMFTMLRGVYPLVSGTRDYTIGPGGTFNQARPQWIDRACLLMTSVTPNIEVPITVFSDQWWQLIALKDLSSAWVQGVYYDAGDVANLATISTYPTINTAGFSLVLYTPVPVNQFANLTTIYSLPPGYAKALRYNLAMVLAPEYGVMPMPLVVDGAAASLADIKRVNVWVPELTVNPRFAIGLTRFYDYDINVGP